MAVEYIKEDLVSVRTGNRRTILAWGDPIEILGKEGKKTRVRVLGHMGDSFEGLITGTPKTQPESVLKFSMVDVPQGDGMVLETPQGKVILIDGGDNKLFARYLAARYRNTSAQNPLEVDAIIVTHGDADHFDGLNVIRKTETDRSMADPKRQRKRIFIHPKRVYHNGLVKGGSKLKAEEIFGRTVPTREGRAIVDLVDDILTVDDKKMNRPFKTWKKSLQHWSKRGPIEIRRVAFGDKQEFKFLEEEGISVEVIGPIPISANDKGRRRTALPLLRQPPKTVTLPFEEDKKRAQRGFSASHTVNGHSIAFRLVIGNVRFMLTGDLNQESMELLRKKIGPKDLESEIVKAPHHGSADFDLAALKSMSPVVSIISSGDESSRKEHIHPRATLMGALGKVSRGKTPLVLCTELAAFFEMRGPSIDTQKKKPYFGFERTNFGIIQIRTDGSRVLVFTHSGREGMKEAYSFTVDKNHNIRFARDVTKR